MEPIEMSDEIKLQLIKNELKALVMGIKMQITIQPTIEVYRQLLAGELPEELENFAQTEEYKQMFDSGVKAQMEVMSNFINSLTNICTLYGIDLQAELPHDPEGFIKMSRELRSTIEGE